jgi:ketosteroid isomerase-like protein
MYPFYNTVAECVQSQEVAMQGSTVEGPRATVERLCRAVNEHDLEALAGCFALDYRNETPAHPARGFQGRSQVRRNWEQIFAAVPDITAEVRSIADGDTVWSEWEMRGTRANGSPHLMRGVVIFGVDDGEATWARFYLEPVEEGGGDIDATIRRTVSVGPNPDPAPTQNPPGHRL